MAQEEQTERDAQRTRAPDDVRPAGQVSIMQMAAIGAVASLAGIALGLLIDWFPVQGSTQAEGIDTLYDVLIIASVPVFVLCMVVVLFSVWKFRQRPGEELADGPPIHGNTRLEIVWTTIPAILLVGLCTYAYIVLRDIEEVPAAAQRELRVEVTGQQFTWTFRYPGEGGVRSNELYLPVDRPVKFDVTSRDVIHDFWVPAFRMKIDAVPGITTSYRVTPRVTGDHDVVCAELCGVGHAYMRQRANVVTEQQFTAWVREQRGRAGGGGGAAGGTAGAGGTDSGAADAKGLFAGGNGEAIACGSCHTLADAKTTGQTGPELDAVLKGQSADEIRASIVEPNARQTQGFGPGIMPGNYGDTLSGEELDGLVEYLVKVAAE